MDEDARERAMSQVGSLLDMLVIAERDGWSNEEFLEHIQKALIRGEETIH